MPARRPPLASTTVARDLVVRPPRHPAAKPYNPFGVAAPSKTMDLKRSDSFFNAADQHSKALSREASQQDSEAAESSKRASKRGSDAESEEAPAKKTSKTAAAADMAQGRAQSKLAAFSFKKSRPADQ
ncbi:hypothetical protein EC988_005522 [Linderina pennispora]|nr:hypothetical protein EC988_005522 [Linderina pennispora]